MFSQHELSVRHCFCSVEDCILSNSLHALLVFSVVLELLLADTDHAILRIAILCTLTLLLLSLTGCHSR
jgi:uncharacterized membrane protein